MLIHKNCTICKLLKPIFLFGNNKNIQSGYGPVCKECNNLKMKIFRKSPSYNKDLANKKVLERYNKRILNPDELIKIKKNYTIWASKNRSKLNEKQRIFQKKKRLLKPKKNKKSIEEIRARNNAYSKKRWHNDEAYRTSKLIRSAIKRIASAKTSIGFHELGYDTNKLIESLGARPSMEMQIDHKIPIAWFNEKTHYSLVHHLDNLHLKSKKDNLSKGDKYCDPISISYFKIIFCFIKNKYRDKLTISKSLQK